MIEYCYPSIDIDGKIWFSNFHLKTDEDVKIMFCIFHRYETKASI